MRNLADLCTQQLLMYNVARGPERSTLLAAAVETAVEWSECTRRETDEITHVLWTWLFDHVIFEDLVDWAESTYGEMRSAPKNMWVKEQMKMRIWEELKPTGFANFFTQKCDGEYLIDKILKQLGRNDLL